MSVLSHADRATFTRHAMIRALVRTIGDRRDDLERLAKQCEGDLAEGLRELASGITGSIHDACLETLIEREVRDSDCDREDRRRDDDMLDRIERRNVAAE